MLRDHNLFVLIFYYFIILVNSGEVTHDSTHCQRYHPKPDVIEFTNPHGLETMTPGFEKRCVDLICCTSGTNRSRRITWFQTRDNGVNWFEFLPVDSTHRKIDEEGQVASITYINSSRDAGSYKCVVEGIQEKIKLENTIKLKILDGSSWRDPPMIVEPFEEESFYEAHLGRNLIRSCRALMGTVCSSDINCELFWTKCMNQKENQVDETYNSSVHLRFYKINRAESLSMEAVLVIENVTEGDLGAYKCYARNGNSINYTIRLIFLQEFKPRSAIVQLSSTAGIVGGILLVVIFAGILITYQTRCDLDWKLWRAKRRIKNADKQMNSAQGIYKVALINAVENQEFAKHLKEILQTKFDFTVVSYEEVDYGKALLNEYLRLTQNIGSVLVLLTPELTRDNMNMKIISEVIPYKTPVFIVHNSADTRVMDLGENIRGALSVSPCLVWPDQGQVTTKRQKKIFLKMLQLSLLRKMVPRNRKSEENKRKRCNSSGPLLTPS